MTTTATQTLQHQTDAGRSSGFLPINQEGMQLRQHTTSDGASLERGSTHSEDPLLLFSRRKSEDELNQHSRKVKRFYRAQNGLIDDMLGPLNPVDEEEQEKQMLKVKIAVYGSGLANVILFVLQLVAAISSGSLAIFATMADAFMDLLSSIVMMWAARQASRPNPLKYPAGKARLETAGIMIFSVFMSCVAIFLIIESAQKLAEHDSSPDLTILSIALVSTALAVKFCLFLYCSSLSQFSTAKVFAQDHRNDILVNALGLVTGILGSRLAGWVDPLGSIIIALIILKSWTSTLYEHTQLIVGKSADINFLQRATYIALTHPGVHQVDTCRAYYAGNNLFVEVDIVLPPETPLRDSHDIGESLQIKLETLPMVERAFVHADYETLHRPEHQKSK
ncbi:cation efflux family-domain-containing protein [Syncephalastrum racemosum]|uniref:Cation efflux family-domain-containing protein n=1 Tax=Syncephalastrum racemosum TaxID=13706 RepID=A0A1X2H0C9_SYNRA|nr:cation efflux family-domain-containing protein [Syncephalastrum racemosum]